MRCRRLLTLTVVAGVAAAVTTSCGGADDDPASTAPSLPSTGAAASSAACVSFMNHLPERLAGQARRTDLPADSPSVGYGDPAVTVTCGVPVPAGFGPTASCERADGVDWYVPDDVYTDQQADATLYAISSRPVVQVVVPASYRPAGPAAVLAQLSGDVKASLRPAEHCE